MACAFVQQSTFGGGLRQHCPCSTSCRPQASNGCRRCCPNSCARSTKAPCSRWPDVDLKFSNPKARIIVTATESNLLGVSTRHRRQLQYGLSGQRMGYFYHERQQYEVYWPEINRQQRISPTCGRSIEYAATRRGRDDQLDNQVAHGRENAPPQLYHYNRFLSATVSAGLARQDHRAEARQMDHIAAETTATISRTAWPATPESS